MEIPYDPDESGLVYRVDYFLVGGGARDDVALVVYDVNGPLARQIFDGPALDALVPRELDPTELTPADWIRDVIDTALNSEGHDVCDDCGNRRRVDRPHDGHAVDCEFAS